VAMVLVTSSFVPLRRAYRI